MVNYGSLRYRPFRVMRLALALLVGMRAAKRQNAGFFMLPEFWHSRKAIEVDVAYARTKHMLHSI